MDYIDWLVIGIASGALIFFIYWAIDKGVKAGEDLS